MEDVPELLNERKLMTMARDASHGVMDNNVIQQFQMLSAKVLRDHGTMLAAVPQFQSAVELFDRMDRRLKIVEEGLSKVPHGMKHVETFTRAINAQRASLGANQADEIEDALVEHDKRFAMLSKTIDEQAAKIAELEVQLAGQQQQQTAMHAEAVAQIRDVDEAVQLIDVDMVMERETNLFVLHEMATRESTARAQLGEWVRREFVPNGVLSHEKARLHRERKQAEAHVAAAEERLAASHSELRRQVTANSDDIARIRTTVYDPQTLIPAREDWEALHATLEEMTESTGKWRTEASQRMTMLRTDMTSMQMRHDASLKDQKADVEALLQKQNAFAAREEKERLVLLERLDAVQEDEEVINMVKTEVYQFAIREGIIADPDAEEPSEEEEEAEPEGEAEAGEDGMEASKSGDPEQLTKSVSIAPDGPDFRLGSVKSARLNSAKSGRSLASAKSSKSVRSVSARRNMRANPLEVWEVENISEEMVSELEARMTALLEAQSLAAEVAVANAREEATEGVRRQGKHADMKVGALADDIDALGKAIRGVAEAAASDAAAREAKSQQTMEALLQGLQEQLQIAVGEALEANKEAVSAMVAQQVADMEAALSSSREAVRAMDAAKVDCTEMKETRLAMDKMWKDTQRFLLDKAETSELAASNEELCAAMQALKDKVDDMTSIVYAGPRGGQGKRSSDVESTDSHRQMGRSIKSLQDSFQKMAQSLTAAVTDAANAKEQLAQSVPALKEQMKGLHEEVQTLRAVLNSHKTDALPKLEAKSLIERGVQGLRSMLPDLAREQVQLALSDKQPAATLSNPGKGAGAHPVSAPTSSIAPLPAVAEDDEREHGADDAKEGEGGADGGGAVAVAVAAELRVKVKGLRDELFSFRRDLSLQGTELQGLKDDCMERSVKQSESEMHIRVLRSKLDALQERQLELGHSRAGVAELAVLESRVAELAGFVLPMQISAYDALRASDPSHVPVAAGMTQWRQGSQAERMQEKASKSRAARQGLLGDTGDGAVRETILPPIDSVTRQARSARATVPQGARQQRRAAYSARLGKLGIENQVSEEF